jgi:hypothetical protein
VDSNVVCGLYLRGLHMLDNGIEAWNRALESLKTFTLLQLSPARDADTGVLRASMV